MIIRDSSRTIDVSVVIVSWNVADLLANCIRSLDLNNTECSVEIIVVDNCSQDRTTEMLRAKFPWVQLIESDENIGFARANNLGFRYARGEYVLILNPDTIIVGQALQEMVYLLSRCPEVGMVGPRLIYPNGDIQQPCARLHSTLLETLFCNALKLCELPFIGHWLFQKFYSPYNYNISQKVEAISGAAMMVRHEIIDQVGGFGESFIHTGEDLDLCFRVRKAGWDIYYISDAIVTHFLGQSSNQVPVRTIVNAALSKQQYFRRCFGKHHEIVYRLIVQGIQAPMIVLTGVIKFLLGLDPLFLLKKRIDMAKALWLWRPM